MCTEYSPVAPRTWTYQGVSKKDDGDRILVFQILHAKLASPLLEILLNVSVVRRRRHEHVVNVMFIPPTDHGGCGDREMTERAGWS